MAGELPTPEEARDFKFSDSVVEDDKIEKESKEKEEGQFGALFVQAPYGGDAIQFRGEPTSLLYATSVFADRVHNGEVQGLTDNDLKIMNPAVFDDKFKAELMAYIEEKKPKVIGISCTTSSSVPANEIAQIAKSSAELAGYKIITVMGGAHERDMASMLPDGTSAEQHDPVDISATGESEETFNLLLSLVYEGRSPEEIENLTSEELKTLLTSNEIRTKFKELSGRDGGFAFKLNGESHRISTSGRPIEYDKVPPLPRHLLDEKWTKYYGIFRKNGRDVKTAQIMSCRGCAKKCRFCSETLNFHPKDAKIVTAEIDRITQEQEGVEPYKAVFFDDSTFTAFTRGSKRPDGTFLREPRSIDNLRPVFEKLKEHGLEWGCQTRVDCIDEELVKEMKDAGCTYIYLGVESANQEMLNIMGKGVRVEQIEEAINIIDAAGIRIGMSLMFGSEGKMGDKKIEETESSVDDTFAFVKRKIDEGKNITLVSMNLYTYYPFSTATKQMPREEKIRLAKEGYPKREDWESLSEEDLLKLTFGKPIVHHGYPWNRFEDGQGHHTACVSDEKLARYIIERGIQEIGEVLQGQDLYTVGEVYEEIRMGKTKGYVDLNHSSLTTPKELTEEQKRYIKDPFFSYPDQRPKTADPNDPTGLLSAELEVWLENYEKPRLYAEGILGQEPHDEPYTVLTPNTTEAANTALNMIISYENERHPQLWGKDKNIVVTDAENFSIKRIAKISADQSNPHGRDDWSTYQDYGTGVKKAESEYIGEEKRDYVIKEANIRETGDGQNIIDQVDHNTQAVIFSHVIRDNGIIMDVASICQKIKEKNPNCWTIVDGAQAFGALPQFDLSDLGCDFYVGTPHKTLNSNPFGILALNKNTGMKVVVPYLDALRHQEVNQVIRLGSFPGIKESFPYRTERQTELLSPTEIRSFSAQFDPKVSGRDSASLEAIRTQINELEAARKEIKGYAISLLQNLPGVEIISPQDDKHSNFILSFKFTEQDNRQIVDKLWRLPRPVTLSYIARSDLIRISFDQFNTEEEIDYLIEELNKIISETK